MHVQYVPIKSFTEYYQPGDRGAAGPQLGAGQSLLGEVSSLSARGQVSLHLRVDQV